MPVNVEQTAAFAALAKSFTSSYEARDKLVGALREHLGVTPRDSFWMSDDGIDDVLGPVVIYQFDRDVFAADGCGVSIAKGSPADSFFRATYSRTADGFVFGEPVAVRRKTDYVRDSAADEGAEPGSDEAELPAWLAEALARAAGLTKGAGHKYVRRVPKSGGGFRYFYKVSGGKGLGHEDEMHVGAKFRVTNGGKDGHFEIVGKDDKGNLRIKHDESGHESVVSPTALRSMLHAEHAQSLTAHREKLAADIKAADDPKAKARLLAEAGKYEHTRDLAEPAKPATARSGGSFHEQAAAALGWSVKDARSMSLQSLRDILRPVAPDLAEEATRQIQSGRVVEGAPLSPPKAAKDAMSWLGDPKDWKTGLRPGDEAPADDHTKLHNWGFDQSSHTSKTTGTAARTMSVGDREYQLIPQTRPGKPPGFVANFSMPGRAGSLDAKGNRTATPHVFDTQTEAHAAVVAHEKDLAAKPKAAAGPAKPQGGEKKPAMDPELAAPRKGEAKAAEHDKLQSAHLAAARGFEMSFPGSKGHELHTAHTSAAKAHALAAREWRGFADIGIKNAASAKANAESARVGMVDKPAKGTKKSMSSITDPERDLAKSLATSHRAAAKAQPDAGARAAHEAAAQACDAAALADDTTDYRKALGASGRIGGLIKAWANIPDGQRPPFADFRKSMEQPTTARLGDLGFRASNATGDALGGLSKAFAAARPVVEQPASVAPEASTYSVQRGAVNGMRKSMGAFYDRLSAGAARTPFDGRFPPEAKGQTPDAQPERI